MHSKDIYMYIFIYMLSTVALFIVGAFLLAAFRSLLIAQSLPGSGLIVIVTEGNSLPVGKCYRNGYHVVRPMRCWWEEGW